MIFILILMLNAEKERYTDHTLRSELGKVSQKVLNCVDMTCTHGNPLLQIIFSANRQLGDLLVSLGQFLSCILKDLKVSATYLESWRKETCLDIALIWACS